ncbi:hypothetical protein BTR14_09875 [Rhizobium rhizosphaerae]|uniref:T2SS protein K first SAM-like domain-containing protein n=1 Tax=Xaviernesmea rhizosphaerae TaxID=1672749 RepID=A0ABX3PF36_9HYPH|nr:type II secretion system protein GspK [Xaviernesmea rhizosphaerae]OQP86736.1 hypothetical protein BTR14_09875 [Xaviernesmea rhizosphaerae]
MRILAGRPKGDGYILISVLAVVALLSGLVAALLLVGRAAVDTAGLESRALRREALLQSAVTVVGYQLFVLKRPEEAVNGQQLRLGEGVVSVTVASEAGKVDLNGSGKELLEAAYTAAGLRSSSSASSEISSTQALNAESFASRVIAWRSAGGQTGADTAQASRDPGLGPGLGPGLDQGLGHGPRNGPFRSLDDLRFVAGISAGAFERLRPFLTVYNAPGRLSAFSAPAALVAALPGLSAGTLRELLSVRQRRSAASAQRLSELLEGQASLIDTAMPRTYRVGIEIHADERLAGRRLTVVLSAGATADWPYQVLDWTDGG